MGVNALKSRALRRETPALIFCALSAAVILLICSQNSFLYPLNTWKDINCYVTVARGWRAGLPPYRDLAELKGPLLYAMHVVALLLSPRTYHGIYILEALWLTFTLLIAWRIARLYVREISVAG